jgi:hypothetical protein
VVEQEGAKSGNELIEQQGFGNFVGRPDQREDAVASVGKSIEMVILDTGRVQGFVEQLIGPSPQLLLYRVGSPGGAFHVHCHDGAVNGIGYRAKLGGGGSFAGV